MPDTTVRTSRQLFSQAVRAAEARDMLDSPTIGAGIAALAGHTKEPGYVFTNGRKFNDATGSYE